MNFDILIYLFSGKRTRFVIFPITIFEVLWRSVVVYAQLRQQIDLVLSLFVYDMSKTVPLFM